MARLDRPNVLRDWNAAAHFHEREQGRRAFAYYAHEKAKENITALALLDKDGRIINLGAEPKDPRVEVHGVKMISRFDPTRNKPRSSEVDRAIATTVRIKPYKISLPATLNTVRVVFQEKLSSRTEIRAGAAGQQAPKCKLHIPLTYPSKPRFDKRTVATAENKGTLATAESGGGEGSSKKFQLGPDEPFGKNGETLRQIGHPNMQVFYINIGSAQNKDAQQQVFPQGYAGRFAYPGFADPGIKRFITVYAPLQCRTYYLGSGAGRKLFNTIEKRRRASPSSLSTKFHSKARAYVDNIHKNVVDFILAAFDFFMLPKLLNGDGLGKENKWILKHLAFGRFQATLSRCADRRGGTKLLLRVPETCTTMCCGGCGQPNFSIGNKDVFVCRCCGLKQARDGGAARSIGILNSVKREPPQTIGGETEPKQPNPKNSKRTGNSAGNPTNNPKQDNTSHNPNLKRQHNSAGTPTQRKRSRLATDKTTSTNGVGGADEHLKT